MTAFLEHPSSKILPLESGDRMNRYEFELLTGNMVQVLAMLQQGLSSNEHVEFVQSLSQNS
ncbi:MAG: hypothetical protein KME64_26210 [Scytonematopsis contorta HA4267-MV1]|jgi:hypothetical protein|nr:hypothetical protein [Scytonematopsis contorta HA4267-MV1]